MISTWCESSCALFDSRSTAHASDSDDGAKSTEGMPLSPELSLYRQILFAARRFPSIKRHKIVEEIRQGFRENKSLGGEELKVKLDVAIKGLGQLQQYTTLPKSSTSWSVSMENNPMPNMKEPEPEDGEKK